MFPINYGFDMLKKWKAEGHFVFSEMSDKEFADQNYFIDMDAKNAIRGDISGFG